MPDGVNVSSVLNEQKLTLQFNSVLNFDLADAKVAAPPNIASINQRADVDSSAVDIVLIGEVDVHSFREEKNYVIDVAFQQAEKPALAEPQAAAQAGRTGQAGGLPRGFRATRPLKESTPPQQPAEIPPVTSEMIAEQARIEIKPGQATEAPAVAEVATPAVEKATPAKRNAAPAAEKMAAAPENASPPAEAAKAAQPAEQVQAAAAEAPKAVAPKQAPAPRSRPKPTTPAASSPPPESGAKRQGRHRRGEARQRRPARDVLLCRADARRRCSAAPIRCGWCSTTPSRSMSSRSAPRAAPSSAMSAGCRWKRGRRSASASTGRRCLRSKAKAAPTAPSWTLTFADRVPDAAAAADGVAQHHRSRARQCHRAAGQSRRCCTGWSIPTPATRCWSSPRRRRPAASSSGRISSNCRCWNPSTAWSCIRTPTTSTPRSAPTR